MKRRAITVGILTLAAGAAGVLLVYLMINGTLRVPCVFRACTGLYCPGCGATRAARLLLSGDIAAAVRMNPYIFVAAPLLLYVIIRYIIGFAGGRTYRMSTAMQVVLFLVMAAGIIFTILRNIPGFEFLAPAQI